jgi:hypothetical protein
VTVTSSVSKYVFSIVGGGDVITGSLGELLDSRSRLQKRQTTAALRIVSAQYGQTFVSSPPLSLMFTLYCCGLMPSNSEWIQSKFCAKKAGQ